MVVDAKGAEKIGFINPKGEIVIPAQFDGAFAFEHGKAVVCIGCRLEPVDGDVEHRRWVGGRWGEVDVKGKVTLPPLSSAPASKAKPSPKP